MPYGGGLGLFAGVFAGLAAGFGFDFPRALDLVLLGTLLVLSFGLLDDARPLPPWAKLAAQFFAAGLVVAAGVHLRLEILPRWVNLLVSFLWLVGMANAFNLIDIGDGLAALVGLVAAASFAAVATLTGDAALAALAFALFGGILGFLPHNLPPARIFLGDAGAQALGFVLAAAAVMGSYTAWNSWAFGAPVLILGWPIFDLGFSAVARILQGRSPFRGSEDHLLLRLRAMGWGHARALLWIFSSSTALALMGLGVLRAPLSVSVWIYAGAGGLLLLLGALIGLAPRNPARAQRPRVVGVTGLPGAGKSTFARELAAAGSGEVFDADAAVHRLLAPGGAGVEAVAAVFGAGVRAPGGGIDRKALAARVFGSGPSAELGRLEAVLHPLVERAAREALAGAAAAGAGVLVLDVPLLFESGLASLCDRTVVVVASEEIRKARFASRGADPGDLDARTKRFLSAAERERRADRVVLNESGIENLRREALRIREEWLVL